VRARGVAPTSRAIDGTGAPDAEAMIIITYPVIIIGRHDGLAMALSRD
jgi:hypothetical protein